VSGLVFQRLVVRRMPGIADGGFVLDELARDINIVYGPNGSGKSTTARAIEALLWPRSAAVAEAWVEGGMEIGGSGWLAAVDGGRAKYHTGGMAASLPHSIPGESRDRYRLSLQELLEVEDAAFAKAIMLESAGGYDLAAAARRLSPRNTPSRPRREQEELRFARERLQAARGVQERLQAESATLRQDEVLLAGRGAHESRLRLLELCTEYAERSSEVRQKTSELEGFHPLVARLNGDEGDRLAGLRSRLKEAGEEARTAAERVHSAGEEIERLGLPPELLEGDHLREISARVVELERIDAEVRTEDRAAAGVRAQLAQESRAFGVSIDPARLAGVDLSRLGAFSGAARSLGEIRAARSGHEAELSTLGEGIRSPADRPRLERGVFLLQQWLRAEGSPGPTVARVRRLAFVGAGLLLGGGFLLGVIHPAALLLAVAGLILLVLTLRQRGEVETRPGHEAEYESLGLRDAPRRWDEEEVRSCLHRLEERVGAARREEELTGRRSRLRAALADLARREEPLRSSFEAIAAELGLDTIPGDIEVSWLVERIARWQSAHAEVAKSSAALLVAWRHRSDALSVANERLSSLRIDDVQDLPGLKAVVEGLEERARAHARSAGDLRQAEVGLHAAERRAEELDQEIRELLVRLELDPAEEHRLTEFCADRPAFLEAKTAYQAAERERARLEERLRGADGFDESLLLASGESHASEIHDLATLLESLDQLRDRVTALKRDIQRAKEGHEVEDAVAELDRCIDALREVRDRDVRSAIAGVLVEHVDRATRNQHRPEVFHRANALFTRITRGLYELRLAEGDVPAFLAYDSHRERLQPLEELSSATRLQLLLAVRIAFVEEQEGGMRLPILMDETLANSDDERAEAIMDAVLELAVAGRQIFYFTAQPDEVGKWQAALGKRRAVEGRIIDLGAIRKLQHRLEIPTGALAIPQLPGVPVPASRDHEQYGRLLGVPSIDVHAPMGSLHLWYLVDAPEALFDLLTALGADRWGAFRTLVDQGGGRLLAHEQVMRLEVLGVAARTALQRLQVGRGRRIQRDTLVASGVVSERFIDEVASLCASGGGDGRWLLERLEARAVPGFFKRNVEALRDFLQTEGFYDPREPLRSEAIRLEVIAAVSAEIEAGTIGVPEIDRLLSRLRVGVGPLRLDALQESLLPDPLVL